MCNIECQLSCSRYIAEGRELLFQRFHIAFQNNLKLKELILKSIFPNTDLTDNAFYHPRAATSLFYLLCTGIEGHYLLKCSTQCQQNYNLSIGEVWVLLLFESRIWCQQNLS